MATSTKKKSKTTRAKSRPKAAAKKSAAKSAPAKAARAKAAPAKKSEPKGMHLRSAVASLTVDDIAASVNWYTDVLGYSVVERWEHEGVLRGVEMKAGDASLYLGQDDWKKGRDRVKGQGIRLYWYTTQDIDRMADGIKARGGTLASEPRDQYGARSFDLQDPTGYLITVSTER